PEARGPAIFCLTSSGTVSGTRNFFAGREALAGCRGAALSDERNQCRIDKPMSIVTNFQIGHLSSDYQPVPAAGSFQKSKTRVFKNTLFPKSRILIFVFTEN
ncbi:hypothetical protein ACJEL2_25955, partial [Escherichia coli]